MNKVEIRYSVRGWFADNPYKEFLNCIGANPFYLYMKMIHTAPVDYCQQMLAALKRQFRS